MVNVFLIIIGVVMLAAIIAANFYILVYFQHEEDKNTAIFPKIVTVAGLTLTCVNILLLPFDVGNSRTNGGIPMQTIWLAFYVIVAVMAIGVLPFAIFYYEAEDPDTSNSKQIKSAVIYESITAVIFVVVTVVLWLAIGIAEVPVNKLSSNLTPAQQFTSCPGCVTSDDTINYRISFLLYVVSMLTFIGMFLFVVFGGIGLAALPMDLINGYRKRPKFINLQTYIARKMEIGKLADSLLTSGKKLNDKLAKNGGRPSGRSQRNEYNKFRAAVFILEEDFKRLEKAYNRGVGPRLLQVIWDYTQLVLGIIGIVISLCWLLHIILYVIPHPPIHPFLNSFFYNFGFRFWIVWNHCIWTICFLSSLVCYQGKFQVWITSSFYFFNSSNESW